jgi:TctA family transporter
MFSKSSPAIICFSTSSKSRNKLSRVVIRGVIRGVAVGVIPGTGKWDLI